NQVRLWSLADQRPIWLAGDVRSNYGALLFSKDSKQLIVGGFGAVTTLSIHDPKQQNIHRLGPTKAANALHLEDDGNTLWIAGEGEIQKLDLATGDLTQEQAGLTARMLIPWWVVALVATAWLCSWTIACTQLRPLSEFEFYPWGIVVFAGVIGCAHWLLLL